ncbi:MAG: orotidine-5'-phosphate decarboxylase [Halanaerobiales bacterium]|jgi:orotidine-5'-phosphate decarboxylase
MKKELIIALDFKNRAETEKFLEVFQEEKPFLKVGMELFYSEGPAIIKALKEKGHRIFLDLKCHDIPNTVKRSMAVLAGLGVDLVNVHAGGGIKMMEAAVEGLEEGAFGKRPLCIAVTQLTSISPEILSEELLVSHDLKETVLHYARNARKAGLDGVVCSPLEAGMIKADIGQDFITVTPGIRLKDSVQDDQVRITTPLEARELGSDYIVVGRPITRAKDPLAIYRQMKAQFTGEESL